MYRMSQKTNDMKEMENYIKACLDAPCSNPTVCKPCCSVHQCLRPRFNWSRSCLGQPEISWASYITPRHGSKAQI
ncbi:hypothetical protein BYT27DRAFT_7308422 [Phlegmacium glaucopus]|nr:hypothetical protein BYT27DRAFT_7308422 [Phlegmacium glaucopus]